MYLKDQVFMYFGCTGSSLLLLGSVFGALATRCSDFGAQASRCGVASPVVGHRLWLQGFSS